MFLAWLLLPVVLLLAIAAAMVCILLIRPNEGSNDVAQAFALVIRALKDRGRQSS